jgi:hypothetical protein
LLRCEMPISMAFLFNNPPFDLNLTFCLRDTHSP